jgi:hypothetical protein
VCGQVVRGQETTGGGGRRDTGPKTRTPNNDAGKKTWNKLTIPVTATSRLENQRFLPLYPVAIVFCAPFSEDWETVFSIHINTQMHIHSHKSLFNNFSNLWIKIELVSSVLFNAATSAAFAPRVSPNFLFGCTLGYHPHSISWSRWKRGFHAQRWSRQNTLYKCSIM